jgi:ATP-dependent helicase HrpB
VSRALPIEPLLPAIRDALAGHAALVLQAAPGAGKTTLVPPALLIAEWLGERSIVMLEPRRLATRAAAYRIADLHGERIGETIGYRMRGDSRVSARTRIEVVTEGILTRRIQHDPTLDGVGLLIFDEYHERSLDADLGLALALRTQSLLRDDLKILVMSATLDGSAVAQLLGGAPVISSEGREFPVDTRYIAPRADARLDATVSAAISTAIREQSGDILVFLPGAGEIRRLEETLRGRELADTIVAPLFGALSHEEQDRAILPDPHGRRKIVLATSIAETSLTIEGIRVVIDSGLSRVPRFSPLTGMARLDTVRVSLASADQRRGRAGRLGPGVCYRLWPDHETHHLLATTPPEITSADLAPLALDLAASGVSDPGELRWLDAPAPAAYAQARGLLAELEAVGESGELTPHGREMASLPMHPRLAHMLIHARERNAGALGCRVAALLSERDVFRGRGDPIDADIALRIDAMRRDGSVTPPAGADLDRDALRRARAEAERLARQLKVELSDSGSSDQLGALLALAYPERVAQRRAGSRSRFLLRNGRGAELTGAQLLATSPFIVAAELDDRRPESRVFLAAAIDERELRELFAQQIVSEEVIEIDESSLTLEARRRERLGAISLRDVVLGTPDRESVVGAWTRFINRRGLAEFPWSDSARRLRERLAFVAHHDSAWPDVSDTSLAARLNDWLAPMLGGRVPVTMQLLSPAHRPVQVTRDLAGFWRTSYFDVRKDLRGRYPKHEWPEDPLNATPTRRAKPRK